MNEALSPRPAALDPAELAKSEDRNRLLMKEIAILSAGLDYQMAENKQLMEKAAKAVEFEQQMRSARAELAVARREAEDLREERDKLQARVDGAARKTDAETAVLKKEIDSLRGDLASARSSPNSREVKELAALRQDLTDEKAISQKLRRENAALLHELDKRDSIRITPASFQVAEVANASIQSDGTAQSAISSLWQNEHYRLQRELDDARSELSRRDPALLENRVRSLTDHTAQLQARIHALEAKPEPYSPEELALFQAPARREKLVVLQVAQATPSPVTNAPPAAPTTVPRQTNQPPASSSSTNVPPATGAPASTGSSPRRRTVNDLPAGAGQLARQAERAFSMRRFEDAERAYREILQLDENNVFTIGNLAAILIEQGRLPEGEAMANRALAIDPEDPFSLSLVGIIRFRQQRYEEAFSALSRSAQIDPENADTQNYLGITLSQRGQRKAAEAALRKALKLNPASASAHYNLAVVYATQKPPFLELARFHYQKARRAGQPANPAFEEVLDGKAPPGDSGGK